MIRFIQQFFLNPYLIFLILLVEIVVVSIWALRMRKEYVGYGLGWLIGIFGLVVYGALVGENEVAPPAEATVEYSMNFLQVIMPSLLGFTSGAWIISLVIRSRKAIALRSIVVTLMTTVSFWLLIFLAIAAPYITTQRMIGLFTWAFGIGALMMLAFIRQQELQKQQDAKKKPNNPDRAAKNINRPQPRNVPQAKIEEQGPPRRFGDRSDR